MKKSVVVLGGTGMLGAMVTDVFARADDLALTATRRSSEAGRLAGLPVAWRIFDAFGATADDCRKAIAGAAWVVNCIGITKPLIKDEDAKQVERAIRVNSMFPHALATAAEAEGARVLQIATDCVYSGASGNYNEKGAHDALDVYGKSKSLGEVYSPAVHHLRSSIIGPEPKDHKFLLDWFVGQPRGASVNGFTNHDWNGVTTLQFAKVCLGVIRKELKLPHIQHLVPGDRMTKAAMLNAFSRSYGRSDVQIKEVLATTMIDRTLSTLDDATNHSLWSAAGYASAPTVAQMIEETARYGQNFGRLAAA
jgi:dTDP-4-dehydrorhamnose reductase